MKLCDYVPTKRWVLCFPIIQEQTESGIYLAPNSSMNPEGVITPRFEIVALGALCDEEYRKGDEVIIEPTTRLMQLNFTDCKDNQPVCFLDHSIMGKYTGKKTTKLIQVD